MRFAEEALAISEAIGVPLALAMKATKVTKLAVKMKVNIFLYVVKKLTDRGKINLEHLRKRSRNWTYIEDSE
jgi:hypothetical protein